MVEYKYKIGDRLSRDGGEYGEVFAIEPSMEGLELMHPHLYWVRFSHGEYPLTEDYLDKEYKPQEYWEMLKSNASVERILEQNRRVFLDYTMLRGYIRDLGIDPDCIQEGKYIPKKFEHFPPVYSRVRFLDNKGSFVIGMITDIIKDDPDFVQVIDQKGEKYKLHWAALFTAEDVIYIDITGGAFQHSNNPNLPLWIIDWEDFNY